MAENTEKKNGSFLGILILILIAFIAGGVVGRTQLGWQAESLYHSMRYAQTPVAKDFLSKPFKLNIQYRQNAQGELETYLVNAASNELLPIYDINGTTQVGQADHRIAGLKDELLDDAKEGGSTALEKAKQLLEFLDR